MARPGTERQQEIYTYISDTIASRGIPPTLREIGRRFGISSTNGVDKHLRALERDGRITRERGASRSIALPGSRGGQAVVPILGRVAAGAPVLSPENREGECAFDRQLFGIRPDDRIFALRVKGDSMVDAHILDGDTVLVEERPVAQNGEIVVALVEGEATVKRFFAEAGRVRLQPENAAMRPFVYEQGDVRIIGRVVGVMRRV